MRSKPNEQIAFIVDDDEAARSSLSLLLRSARHASMCSPSAHNFLAAYDPEQFGCAIMDLRVLGSWGLTAQRSLQQRGIKLPIIFISRHARVTDTVAASRASALDMLEKPYDPQVLLERVSETLTLDAKQRNALAARATMTARL